MKVFEYLCKDCGVFELLRPSGLRNHPGPCTKCGKLSARAISIPHLSQLDPKKKIAIEKNIKSQHEPEICGSDCQHEHNQATPSQMKGQPKYKNYTGPRSWVIEHAR
jgi:phage FluMu protein Com